MDGMLIGQLQSFVLCCIVCCSALCTLDPLELSGSSFDELQTSRWGAQVCSWLCLVALFEGVASIDGPRKRPRPARTTDEVLLRASPTGHHCGLWNFPSWSVLCVHYFHWLGLSGRNSNSSSQYEASKRARSTETKARYLR
ncbi:hypothetical protein B0T19DRAFT_276238 [Cercophora scortea]|uniref:Secreted protein n=1 Tax=Cercophora scortea TaxID=314031 RepID=A0AAE0I8A6_9PEZI|nr:hypothetical protein B0T19DRAFT_276238 [Cercophora scortea]